MTSDALNEWVAIDSRSRAIQPLLIAGKLFPGCVQDSVKQCGCYSLIIYLTKNTLIRIGKLGRAAFPAGTYVYTGSAMGGLEPRLKRHLRSKKKLRWHIDYLLHAREAKIREIFIYPPLPGEECRRNRIIAALPSAKIILPKFSASDCKVGCGSHLFYFAKDG